MEATDSDFPQLLDARLKKIDIDGLVQDCSNFSAPKMELLQPCTKPSIKIERPQPRQYHNVPPQRHNSSNAERNMHTYIEYGRKEPGSRNVNFQPFTYVLVLRKVW